MRSPGSGTQPDGETGDRKPPIKSGPRLSPNERRYLSRHVCYLCDMALHRDYCGSMYGECSPEIRAKRRTDCLKEYKPRDKQKSPAPGSPDAGLSLREF